MALKLRFFAWLWRKRDGTAKLQDNFRHGIAQTPDLIVVLLKVFRNMTRLGIATMDVRRTLRLRETGKEQFLDLLIPSYRELLSGVQSTGIHTGP